MFKVLYFYLDLAYADSLSLNLKVQSLFLNSSLQELNYCILHKKGFFP